MSDEIKDLCISRRPPKSIPELLKLTMEVKGADPDHDPIKEPIQMDKERKQFLENALREATISIVDEMQKAIDIFMKPESTEEQQTEALEVLSSYVIDIDAAKDFVHIGGLNIIMPGLNSKSSEVQIETANLIAELAQNHPYLQSNLLQIGTLEKLIAMPEDNFKVTVASIRAISCLIRNNESVKSSFMKVDGLKYLTKCIGKDKHEKIITKSLFLISSLCLEYPEIKSNFIKLNIIEKIVDSMVPKDEYDALLELSLETLLTLTECEIGKPQAKNSLKLKEKLIETKKLAGTKEECKEQFEYSQKLLKDLFEDAT